MAVIIDTISNLRPRHPEKVHRPDVPALPKPNWIRVRAPVSKGYAETHKIIRDNKLVTVCEEAGCPNIGECWDKKHATFMIMGDTCTRACAFCNVKTGLPGALDALEPEHVAEATLKLGLHHVVITSVDRDDLADGGAEQAAMTLRMRTRIHPELGTGRPDEVVAALADEAGTHLAIERAVRERLLLADELSS